MAWIVVYVLLVAVSISSMWAVGWYFLAATMLYPRVGAARCAGFCGCFTFLHTCLNVVVSLLLTGEQQQVFIEYGAYFEFGLFFIQGTVLTLFLHRRGENPAKVVSAAALSYFALYNFLNTFTMIFEEEIYRLLYSSTYPEKWLGDALPYLITLPFALLVALLLRRLNFRKYFGYLFGSRAKSTVTLIGSLLLMNSYRVVLLLIPAWAESLLYSYVNLAFVFLIILLLLLLAVLEAHRARLKAQERELWQQKAYVQSLEHIQGEVRAFQHDYQNVLSGLYLQAQQGDIAGVQSFLRGTLQYFDDNLAKEIQQTTSLAKVEVPEVKSLLLVKLMQLQKLGIKAGLEVVNPVHTIAMETEDFTRCLGILMDNAAEAAAKAPEGYVGVVLLQEGATTSLVVKNTYGEKPVLHQLEQKGFTTKGPGRGTGLASYRGILRRCPNAVANTLLEGELFVQELIVGGGGAK